MDNKSIQYPLLQVSNVFCCSLLRLLHPIMPFVTEEIWTNLAKLAPERGFDSVEKPVESITIAAWPKMPEQWQNESIEQQFALYQSALGAVREIRASQNIPNKTTVNMMIRCQPEVADLLQPLSGYFSRMAASELVSMGPDIEPPEINAVLAKQDFEVIVDLDGLIDKDSEIKRLEKDFANVEKSIASKERQLGNEKFVAAKPELAEEIRASLSVAKEQRDAIAAALSKLRG